MDDVISGIVMLMAIAAAVALAIAVALAMVGAAAVVGSVIVGIRGMAAFLTSFSARLRSRGGRERKPLPPEPANELYVLGQLRRDLRSAGDDAWAAMLSMRTLTGNFAARHNELPTLPLGIGALVGGYMGTGVGVVISGILALPVLLVAGIIMVGSWALIGVLRAAESVRRRVRRASYECPVDHERFPLPVYVCPGCGAEHKQLVPGRWGIIKRECRCGQVALPTMVLNGRQRVPQRCPSGHPMSGLIGFTEMLRIAFVAGPRAGKTTFLAGALHELDAVSKAGTLAVDVLDQSRSSYDEALDKLEKGQLPSQTQKGVNPALVTEVQGGGRSRVLSLYDVAGESYAGDDAIRELRFMEVPSGLLMLIDPLALERFAADHQDEIAAANDLLRPSQVRPIRVLETTLGSLAAAGARTDKLPIAVVVGKTDALGIDAEIRALQPTHGDRAVPEWLEAQGAGNFVREVESSFGAVGWFSATALGRMPDPADRSAFVPSGTAAPVLWLLEQNGITPAKGRFEASQAADRLSGASAQDFPPITSRGWALRAVPAGLASLLVMLLTVLGLASALRSGASSVSANGDVASVSDTTPTDEEPPTMSSSDTTTFDRGQFKLTLPTAWEPGQRDRYHSGDGAYTQSDWHVPYDVSAKILVDYTTDVGASAAANARLQRANHSKLSDYQEVSWGPATLDGHAAWRWEFIDQRRHKVDYFVNDNCGTGFAILAQSSPGNWDKYDDGFESNIQSLKLSC